MTFIPADGTNSATANSYVTVAYADAYFSDRGITAWNGSDNTKQAALVRATDYINQTYTFIGVPISPGLPWPRYTLAYGTAEIPDNIKKATCELAIEALTGSLNPVSGGTQNVIRKKVDVIEVEYDKAVTTKRRPAVDGYLAALVSGSAYNRPVVRV